MVASSLKSLDMTDHAQLLITDRPLNVRLAGSNKNVFWLAQCTQGNMLTAMDNLQVPMIGYFNELSHTQQFNCQKLAMNNVGFVIEDSKIPSDLSVP